MRREFWSVVEHNKGRVSSALEGQSLKGGNDAISVDGVVNDDRQTLPGELVDDVQQLDLAAVDGGVELEVECPEGIGSNR